MTRSKPPKSTDSMPPRTDSMPPKTDSMPPKTDSMPPRTNSPRPSSSGPFAGGSQTVTFQFDMSTLSGNIYPAFQNRKEFRNSVVSELASELNVKEALIT